MKIKRNLKKKRKEQRKEERDEGREEGKKKAGKDKIKELIKFSDQQLFKEVQFDRQTFTRLLSSVEGVLLPPGSSQLEVVTSHCLLTHLLFFYLLRFISITLGTDLIYISSWFIVFKLVGEETEGRKEGSEGREGEGRRGRRRKGEEMKEGDKEGRGGERTQRHRSSTCCGDGRWALSQLSLQLLKVFISQSHIDPVGHI